VITDVILNCSVHIT